MMNNLFKKAKVFFKKAIKKKHIINLLRKIAKFFVDWMKMIILDLAHLISIIASYLPDTEVILEHLFFIVGAFVIAAIIIYFRRR